MIVFKFQGTENNRLEKVTHQENLSRKWGGGKVQDLTPGRRDDQVDVRGTRSTPGGGGGAGSALGELWRNLTLASGRYQLKSTPRYCTNKGRDTC